MLAVAVAVLGAAGCGEALFMSGLVPRPKVEAAFKFGDGPVAVLVDDYQEAFYWPGTANALSDAIVEELLDRGAARTVVPTSAVIRLRQTDPQFDERACTEIGRALKADQVLLVEARSFYATEDPTEEEGAARMSVAIKVINARERKDRRKVRLWPTTHEGYIVQVELGATEITRAKIRDRILRELTQQMAAKIVRKFYDRRMEPFEKEE